ncbi:MAG: VCBS repeat-containing protein [Turneriella sp.]|nr:VCBS repeat-containing protein [Turneriella sp.]
MIQKTKQNHNKKNIFGLDTKKVKKLFLLCWGPIQVYSFVIFLSVFVPLHAGVNSYGGYSEIIPIEIPAGRNGVQPKLALSYTSNSGNGFLGVGWKLQGLQAITRINYGRGVNYDGLDTYSGPEGRLIDMNPGSSTLYHAENESWTKYEPIGFDGNPLSQNNKCGDAACIWHATDRNGIVYVYGGGGGATTSGDSSIIAVDSSNNSLHSGAVRTWVLKSVTDLNGNYYTIDYYQDNGQYYPKKITYTLGGINNKKYTVLFSYDGPSRIDQNISYGQSSYVQTRWRLDQILVQAEKPVWWIIAWNTQVRRYKLGYDFAPDGTASRLINWQEFDASDNALPAVTFTWQNGGNVLQQNWHSSNLGGWDPSKHIRLSGDVNGDGKADVIEFYQVSGFQAGCSIWLSDGTGVNITWNSSSCGGWLNGAQRMVGDVNGDGKADIIEYYAAGPDIAGCTVWLSDGNGIYLAWNNGSCGGWSNQQSEHIRMPGDINGDGLTDVIEFYYFYGEDGVGSCTVWLSNGSGLYPSWNRTDCGSWVGDHNRMTADVDGDGKTDIIDFYESGGQSGCMIWKSDGTGLSPTWNNPNCGDWHSGGHTYFANDVNGDGKTDVIEFYNVNGSEAGCRIFISNGSALTEIWNNPSCGGWSGGHIRLPADVNGDGRIDIVEYWDLGNDRAGCTIWSSTGTTLTMTFVSLSCGGWGLSEHQYMPADIDGDGKTDILEVYHRGSDVAGGSVWLNYLPQPNLLTVITSSTGANTLITYAPAIGLNQTVCPAFCASPDGEILTSNGKPNVIPRYLVSSIAIRSDMDLDHDPQGQTDAFITTYQYYNGRVSTGTVAERASLGFEKVKVTDVKSGNYEITTYRQDKPFHTTMKAIASYIANGTLISEQFAPATLQQYYCAETGCVQNTANDPTPTQPKQIRQVGPKETRQYINGVLAMITQQEIISYDAYGNQLVTNATKRLGTSMVTTQTNASYINNPGDRTPTTPPTHARAIGLPATTKQCILTGSGACTLFNTSDDRAFFYDDQTAGQIGSRHLLTNVKNYVGATTLSKNFTYSPSGNLLTETSDTAAVKTYVYEPDYDQYLLETHVAVPTKPEQVTTQTVDVRFGIVTEVVDVNGTKTQKDLDAHGRPIEQRIVGNNGTLLRRIGYEYHPFGNANPTDHYLMQCAYHKSTPLDTSFTERDCIYTYTDALGRKYLTVSPAINGTAVSYSAVHTKYDSRSRVVQESLPYFKSDASSNLGSPLYYSQTTYDVYGRVWQQISADGKVTQTDIYYSGGDFVATDVTIPDGTVHESTSDVRGQIARVTKAKGSGIDSSVTYTYYPNGMLWYVTAPQGVTTIAYYPDTKQQQSIVDPNVGTTTYVYETDITKMSYGKMLTETRPAPNGSGNVVVTNEYNDIYGRISRQTYSTGDEIIFKYDETDVNLGKNRLTTNEHHTQGYTYKQRHSYDEFGEVSTTTDISHQTETLCSDPMALPCHTIVSGTFDESGRKISMVYPDASTTTIAYYGASPQVASIAHNNVTYATYDGYDNLGKLSGAHYGNGTYTQYTYDSANGKMMNLKTYDVQNRAIQNLDYTFTDNRNIATLTDNVVTDASYIYTYDALDRIESASRSDGKIFNYAFDAKGNLTLKENRTQAYYSNSTKLQYSDLSTSSGIVRTNFSWSASGNLLQRSAAGEAINYTWSSQNFLIKSTRVGGALDGATTTNIYAGEGNKFLRLYQQPGKQLVKTWNLGGMEIRETFSGTNRDNVQITKFIYGIDGGRLSSITGNPGDLVVAATSSHQFSMARFYSGQSVNGFIAKSMHTFVGCYYFAGEFYTKCRKEILVTLLVFSILVFLLVANPAKFSMREYLRRCMALIAAMGILNASNCSSGKQDPAFSNGTYGTPIAAIDALYTGLPAGTVYYHANHIGSSTLVTDANGLEKIRIHYTAYGEIDQNLSGRWDFDTSTLIRDANQVKDAYLSVSYTGQEYSAEEEMYDYSARHYDPTVGIMISADTMVPYPFNPDSYNRFQYAAGNPVKYRDPTGHWNSAGDEDYEYDDEDYYYDAAYGPGDGGGSAATNASNQLVNGYKTYGEDGMVAQLVWCPTGCVAPENSAPSAPPDSDLMGGRFGPDNFDLIFGSTAYYGRTSDAFTVYSQPDQRKDSLSAYYGQDKIQVKYDSEAGQHYPTRRGGYEFNSYKGYCQNSPTDSSFGCSEPGIQDAGGIDPFTLVGAAAGIAKAAANGASRLPSIWTSTSKLSSVENAYQHWLTHGAEFPNLRNAKQYVDAARDFMKNSQPGTLLKTRSSNGDILKYQMDSNTFGVINDIGEVRTMFKPTDGFLYWLSQ